ncbi:hypothetical protein [Brevundimonas bacteroides]|uniref:hypothetical protein n=1 Tax=Brevundimonas bacteroides TaxID=74311 RepID=UPI00049537E5|nr:hypothetical protein [Brevundimonas bacteroides]
MRFVALAITTLIAAAPVVVSAQDAAVPMQDRTERIGLSGRRGPSLFRPGFAVGEYTGWASLRDNEVRLPWQSRDFTSAELSIVTPGGEVTANCGGGQGHRNILGITFDREPISYDCDYAGAAPTDAAMGLALSRGSFLARLQQPQRAGFLMWNGVEYRTETRRIGGLPFGNGVLGYVISRDGVEVGGVELNGLRPTFYLPPQGSPDRDAVAVFALSLWAFRDPANR